VQVFINPSSVEGKGPKSLTTNNFHFLSRKEKRMFGWIAAMHARDKERGAEYKTPNSTLA
jgi:hypothetical protein